MSNGGERRLAAILSADIVGYSRHMAADEQATIRTVNEYRGLVESLVQEHRGRLVDFVGDNFLAEFGSALAAVECALGIQDAVRKRNATVPDDQQMSFRIGGHLGDVHIDDGRLYGEGINIAARLESLAETGGICVSDAVYAQVRNRLNLDVEDVGEQALKNIPNPVRAYRVRVGSDAGAAPETEVSPPSRKLPVLPAVISLIVVLALIAYVRARTTDAPSGVAPSGEVSRNEKPSLVVLPFVNVSNDPEQGYFADGITEDIINDLTRLSGISVIARTSSFYFKEKSIPVPEIAEQLNVRYVVEGSVRKMGENVRITAQLIEANSATHLWSNRYDRPIAELFSVQDQVVADIAHALAVEVTETERAWLDIGRSTNPKAYDLVLRARPLVIEASADAHDRARVLLEHCIGLDPEYAEAYVLLSWTYMADYMDGTNRSHETIERATTFAERAVEVSPENAVAVAQLANIYHWRRRDDEGLALARRAIELNRGLWPLQALWSAYMVRGRAEEALAAAQESRDQDPFDPWSHGMVGLSYFVLDRFDDAVRELRLVQAEQRAIIGWSMFLALSHAGRGDGDKAEELFGELFDAHPDFAISTDPTKPRIVFLPPDREREIAARVAEYKAKLNAKPAIVVLPLANMSDDPSQEYFVDGMTEDIITDLSKLSGLSVIARTSAFYYKDKNMPVQDIARELNVGYLVEGSVRKAGNNVRITAQLVEASTGHHLWSERYDRTLTDVFALQDEVTRQIVGALRVTLDPRERAALEHIPTTNIEAYELFLQAQAAALAYTPESVARARRLYQRAIALEPQFGGPHAGLGMTYFEEVMHQWVDDESVMDIAIAHAREAVRVDDGDAYSHAILCLMLNLTGAGEESIAYGRRALEIAPNNALANAQLGYVLARTGQQDEGVALMLHAIRLDPYEFSGHHNLGVFYTTAGRPEDAVPLLRRAAELNPRFVPARVVLAASLGMAGEHADAQREVAELLRISPGYNLGVMRENLRALGETGRMQPIIEALRAAGLPEGELVEARAP